MRKHIFTALIAAAMGFAAGLAIDRIPERTPAPDWAAARPAPNTVPIDGPVAAQLPVAAAESQRAAHYRDLRSVADTIALPGDFAETEALYALAGRADAATLDRYLREAAALANRNDRRGALHILLSRMTELDPRGALRAIESLGVGDETALLRTVFYGWSRLDLDAALAHVPSLRSAEQRQIAAEAILDGHESAPRSVTERIAAALQAEETGVSARARLLAMQAREAPRAALEEALRLTPGNEREQAVYWSVDVWARRDPQAAFAYVQRLSDRRLRAQLEMMVANRWARDDPEAVLDMLPQISDRQSRARLRHAALNRLGGENPLRGIEIAQTLSTRERAQAYSAVFQGWANRDPDGAMQYLGTVEDASLRRNIASQIVYQYAQRNPQQALQWLQQTPPEYGDLRQIVLSVVAHNEPARAIDAAAAVASPVERAQMLTTVITAIAEVDPRQAVAYLDRLEPGAQRQQAAAQIASQWGQSEPAAALQWALGLEGDAYQHAVMAIGWQLAMHDPDLAARQLGRIEQSARSDWIRAVVNGYALHDTQRAMAWASQFQGEPLYAELVGQVAQTLVQSDPRAAVGMVERIGDDDQRTMMLRDVVSTWAGNDPREAAAYVARFADEQARPVVAGAVAMQWAAVDHDAARGWALTLPSGTARDEALSMVAQYISDAADALSLMESIGSVEARTRVFNSVFYPLAQADPVQARRVLAQARIDGQSKQEAANWLEQQAQGGRK